MLMLGCTVPLMPPALPKAKGRAGSNTEALCKLMIAHQACPTRRALLRCMDAPDLAFPNSPPCMLIGGGGLAAAAAGGGAASCALTAPIHRENVPGLSCSCTKANQVVMVAMGRTLSRDGMPLRNFRKAQRPAQTQTWNASNVTLGEIKRRRWPNAELSFPSTLNVPAAAVAAAATEP